MMDSSIVSCKTLKMEGEPMKSSSPALRSGKNGQKSPPPRSKLSHHRSNSKLTPVQEKNPTDCVQSENRDAHRETIHDSQPQSLRGYAQRGEGAQESGAKKKPSISKSIKSSMMRPKNR